MTPLTVQNKAARRFVLVRYAQCAVHRRELAEGIAEARSDAVSYALTDVGLERCAAARAAFLPAAPFYAPAQQAGAQLAYAPTAHYTDGSEQAQQTLNALLGRPLDAPCDAWADAPPSEPHSLSPIVIVAGSAFILDKLKRDLDFGARFGPPLLSACVYDVFADGSPPFVHALGDKQLCAQSLYWANSA